MQRCMDNDWEKQIESNNRDTYMDVDRLKQLEEQSRRDRDRELERDK